MNTLKDKQKGFTLIELMAVVAIVGILAAIAYPNYANYVIRGKIPNATSNLASKRILMEQYFQDNHTYVGAPACNSDTTSSQYFTFDCAGTYGVAANAAGYTLEAVGNAGGPMDGFNYTVDQNNTKTSAIVSPAKSAWRATSGTCWITNICGTC